jgi:hypothetical protein
MRPCRFVVSVLFARGWCRMAWVVVAMALIMPAAANATVVGTSGSMFTIDGVVTHQGTSIAGVLVNLRTINGIFDDANLKTVWRWSYPDTGLWDPNRNTAELVAALPTYHAYGVDAITVGLQGGRPLPQVGIRQTWNVSAFNKTGSLKSPWMARLDRVLTAANALHMVVTVSLFYQYQDQRLADDTAVFAACDHLTDWLTTTGPHAPYRNVLVEVANEIDSTGYDRAVLSPDRITELIQRIQVRSAGTLPVSVSFRGLSTPTPSVVAASDYVDLHSTNRTTDDLAATIAAIRAMPEYIADPKPIIDTEDGGGLAKMDVALAAGVGWGYHDQGLQDYLTGFQSVPINWGISTPAKQAFFDRARWWTGAG